MYGRAERPSVSVALVALGCNRLVRACPCRFAYVSAGTVIARWVALREALPGRDWASFIRAGRMKRCFPGVVADLGGQVHARKGHSSIFPCGRPRRRARSKRAAQGARSLGEGGVRLAPARARRTSAYGYRLERRRLALARWLAAIDPYARRGWRSRRATVPSARFPWEGDGPARKSHIIGTFSCELAWLGLAPPSASRDPVGSGLRVPVSARRARRRAIR